LAEAVEDAKVGRNVVRELSRSSGRRAVKQEKRASKKLEVGVDIPTSAEVRKILEAASGRWRPIFVVAAFTGLRASELRGLRWCDVDFSKNEIRVRQRA